MEAQIQTKTDEAETALSSTEECEANKEECENELDEGETSEEKLGFRDYEALMRADLEELKSIFPALREKSSIREFDDPLRYAALRDLGLTPKEAYLATRRINADHGTISHITSSVPKSAARAPESISQSELESARMLFSDLSDREIQKLYRKVTK